MKHKYDRKLNKKIKFATCVNCGVVKEVGTYGMGYIYFKPNIERPYFKAPQCVAKIIS